MADDRTKLMEARTFEVGDVLGRSFAIWAKNFIPFGVIMLIVYAPLYLLNVLMLSGTPSVALLAAYGGIATVLGMCLGMIGTGAVTYGVVMQMRQQPVTPAQSVKVGLSRMFTAIGIVVVLFLIIALPLVLLALIAPALAVIGMIFAFIAMLVFWVAVPVAVVEKLGVGPSLSRSAALTSGKKGAIFLLLLILGVLGGIVSYVFQMLLGSLPLLPAMLLSAVFQAFLLGALGAVVNAVGYQALRTSKEGVSLEDIAKVFD